MKAGKIESIGGFGLQLRGIHHVSALTAQAARNFAFYTGAMGMRLVKKTVNQDDITSYHLFYADELGHPGTDLTFFDIPHLAARREGAASISEVGLRVPDTAALERWVGRLSELGVAHGEIARRGGRNVLPLQDFEGQRLVLVADDGEPGVAPGVPWTRGPVPKEWAIRGLGPVRLTVHELERTAHVLTDILGFREAGRYAVGSGPGAERVVFATGEGGAGAELHIAERPDLPREQLGRGSVHHVAFRVPDDTEYVAWYERLEAAGFHTSGLVDRYYFRSIYFREPNGILFELATDGPGFSADEDPGHLGERLALPPFLEPYRAKIAADLQPLDTTLA